MNGPAPPAWLADEDEICALLQAALDRFDQQPGRARQRPVSLPVQNFLPSLARGDSSADQTWTLIRELAATGVCFIRSRKRNSYDPEWTDAKLAFPLSSEAPLRSWLQRPASESAMQSWRRAIAARAAEFAVDPQNLLARRIVIEGRSDDEVVAALLSIGTAESAASLRQLSARAFWGDSKVLDERADLILALFPHLQLRERPIVAAVHLPTHLAGVLFIENQDSYAMVASGAMKATEQLALVYGAGFRSSASRIRTRAGVLLHYAGAGSDALRAVFEQWWCAEAPPELPMWFWGDLDFPGMQILRSLRARFGDVRAWQPGYAPMVAAVRSGATHPLADRTQLDPGATGCPYADEVLLAAIRERGRLDQEWLEPLHS